MTPLVALYERVIRDIADGVSIRITDGGGSTNFLEAARRRLGFDHARGWVLMCHALDLIGDCELGINHFRLKGFGGSHPGDRILRLSGLLTCCYQQGWGVMQLAELFKVHGKKKIRKEFDNLDIVMLRHVVASHTVTYRSDTLQRMTSFTVSRPGIVSGNIVTIDETNRFHEWDLDDAIARYSDWSAGQLHDICNKAVESLFRTSPKELAQYRERLQRLKNI